jgi:hypothetical protein
MCLSVDVEHLLGECESLDEIGVQPRDEPVTATLSASVARAAS